jgi:von Willebrand factor type A domain/Putative Tad-like Flp pilus-assembly
MYWWALSIALKLRALAHDRRGVAAFVFLVASAGLIGAMGFAVDVGVLLNARKALEANADAAVLNAAYQWDQMGGTQSAALTAAQSWNTTHPVPFFSSVTATASASCIGSSQVSGLPTCPSGGNNAISLTQTGTVPTYFIRVLGFNSWTVSATATAAKAGGPTKALNVMFVLDTTQSMGTTTDDSGCAVPGISKPTRLNCALYGIQLILKQLNPQIDQVGLMVFPGMSSTWTPCGTPNIVAYGTPNMTYQVIHNALDTNYATVMGALNDSSNLVKTVGDNKNSVTGCLKAPGGEGTFYAGAISAAQTALQSQGSSTAQNVIILLSDGEANATSNDMNSTYANNTPCSPSTVCSPGHLEQQCNQAVANGQSAANSGTWVYVIAYDAGGAGTGCPSQTTGSGKSQKTVYDSPTGTDINVWTPCTALQNIASNQTNFYSTNSSCSSVNSYTDVATAFQQAGYTLSQPRLVLN